MQIRLRIASSPAGRCGRAPRPETNQEAEGNGTHVTSLLYLFVYINLHFFLFSLSSVTRRLNFFAYHALQED